MSHTILGPAAFLLELGAWLQLATGGGSDAELLTYLSAHGIASVMLASFAYVLVPSRYARPRWAVLGLIWALIFFVPVLGFLGVILGTVLAPVLPRFAPRPAFRSVRLPDLDPHERAPKATFSQAGVRGFLSNERAPVGLRLRALVALQNVPARVASPLLRGLLADSAEDLRLLAYGMLDGLEKKLNSRIHEELQRFNQAQEDDERLSAARRLSQLFWELIYQGLVQGDLAQHALDQSLRFTQLALTAEGEDPSLQLQLGRLRHLRGENELARSAYQEALGLGMPLTRVLPYLAEAAFEQRDYAEVRRLMSTLKDWSGLARLQPIIRYWDSGSR